MIFLELILIRKNFRRDSQKKICEREADLNVIGARNDKTVPHVDLCWEIIVLSCNLNNTKAMESGSKVNFVLQKLFKNSNMDPTQKKDFLNNRNVATKLNWNFWRPMWFWKYFFSFWIFFFRMQIHKWIWSQESKNGAQCDFFFFEIDFDRKKRRESLKKIGEREREGDKHRGHWGQER